MDPAALANFALVVLFVLIGGVFSGTEMAIVSLRETQVQELEESGPRGAKVARLVRDPNRFLSAVQIGVTVAGFFSSAYGASEIAPSLVPWLQGLGLGPSAAGTVALIVMTLVIAYLSLVLGELVPKRLAMQNALALTRVVGPPLRGFGQIMRPVIWFLSVSTNLVVRLLGGDPRENREEISAEEIRSMVRTSDALEDFEGRVLADVFDAADRTVTEVMRPRTDVAFLRGSLTVSRAREEVRDVPYSRYPVIGADADDVIGFIHVRDLLHTDGDQVVRRIVRPVPQVPGTVGALEALGRMRTKAEHIAVVVDEYGGTDGIVTLEDLLEELVGEIYDEFDVEVSAEDATVVRGGATEVDGGLILQEFADRTGIELPDDGGYETVGGFLMARLGRIPEVGDEVVLAGPDSADGRDRTDDRDRADGSDDRDRVDGADASDVRGRTGVRLRVTAMDGRRVRTVRVDPAASPSD
jgi:putative hemolysin